MSNNIVNSDFSCTCSLGFEGKLCRGETYQSYLYDESVVLCQYYSSEHDTMLYFPSHCAASSFVLFHHVVL